MLAFHHTGKEHEVLIKAITLMKKFLRSGATYAIHFIQYQCTKDTLIQSGFVTIKH